MVKVVVLDRQCESLGTKKKKEELISTKATSNVRVPCAYVNILFNKRKILNASRPSEHPPARGEKMSKRIGGIRLQIRNLLMAFKRVP